MVHLDLESSNDACLRIASDLAEQFNAKLIGVAAASPQPSYYADGRFAQGLVERVRGEIKTRLADVEKHFRSAVQGRACDVEWRSALARPTDYLAHEARAADLIVISAKRDDVLIDPLRRIDPSDVVMQAGRPIFVVPPEAEYLKLKCAMVAWKDTREARRATSDALPLLEKAKEVVVVEVVGDESHRATARARVDDVTAWLDRHGISASGQVFHIAGEEEQLEKLWQYGADFLVSGAYGHARLREWVFGGFTRNVLTRSRHCAFLSH
jgi:nucleotide-binding universal stress UspA family protein